MTALSEPRFCLAQRHDGGECQRKLKYGDLRCKFHGGASPQAIRKAEARREVATVMQRPLTDAERRNPWDIALDALQRLDRFMTSGELAGAEFIEHADRLIKSCKMIIDSGIAERVVMQHERNTEREGRVVVSATLAGIDAVLDHLQISTSWERDSVRGIALSAASRVMTEPDTRTVDARAIKGARPVPASHPAKRAKVTTPRARTGKDASVLER